jgi:DNA-binding NarL/FixJ family response regulator
MTAAVLARPRQSELTVVLADDHPVVRGGLRALLSGVDGITVMAESSTGPEDLASALVLEPDVLIVDLPMRGIDGIRTIQSVLRATPGVAVLVFTSSEDDESVFNAMRAGARGYILKGAEQSDIVRAIRGVAAGEAIFGARIAARLTELMMRQALPDRHPFPELTSREREILDLIAEGLGNAAIAHQLYLAPKTVRNNISAIFAKLGAADRAEAIVRARAAGLGVSRN